MNEQGGAAVAEAARGPDVFQFDQGDSIITLGDRVFDFQSRFDVIELDGVPAGSPQNFVQAPGVFSTEAAALEVANELLNSETVGYPSVQFAAVRVGTDTWLFIDYDRDGFADEEIQFLNITSLHYSDIRNDY